jgi:hypothetical protein
MSKYSWHPPHPPTPPPPALSSKIAAIGPIGKSLEEALHELCQQDLDATDDSSSSKSDGMDESLAKSIMKSYTDITASIPYDCRTKNTGSRRRQSLSREESNTNDTVKRSTAPAAILKGEIQYYNRIGGQWRIIVKNAVLMPRRLKVGTVGSNGRKGVMLDWDQDAAVDNDEEIIDDDGESTSKKRRVDDSEIHRFDGTVQILAYNDDV